MKDNPQAAFDEIVRVYFPRWSAGRSWRCRWTHGRLGPCDGQCNSDRRIVYVSRINTLLFIHEICHAFSTGHGRLWQRRMLAVARRADELGQSEMAQEIRNEIGLYHGRGIGKTELYNMVSDTIAESGDRTCSFRDVVRYLARETGMTQADFLREFPRARKFYDKGKRDKLAWKSAKRRFAAKRLLRHE